MIDKNNESWCVHYCGDNKLEIHPLHDEDGFEVIADINPENDFSKEHAEEMAHLMAAAPDMLKELQTVDKLLEQLGYQKGQSLRAGINKVIDKTKI